MIDTQDSPLKPSKFTLELDQQQVDALHLVVGHVVYSDFSKILNPLQIALEDCASEENYEQYHKVKLDPESGLVFVEEI